MDLKLEVVILPVSDVDGAKAFYERLGFHLDVDHRQGDAFRVVQFTPPGSACSVTFGIGLGHDMAPGSLQGLHLIATDIEAVRADLVDRGVESARSSTSARAGRHRDPIPSAATTARTSRSVTPTATAGSCRRSGRLCGDDVHDRSAASMAGVSMYDSKRMTLPARNSQRCVSATSNSAPFAITVPRVRPRCTTWSPAA